MRLRSLLLGSRDGLLLLPWAVLVGLTLRHDPFGLTEEGAKALLLAWSIGDEVASSAVALGAPDVRVMLFLPLTLLWPGQVLAAKVLTLLSMAVAAIALYRWRSDDNQGEAALLATGLLLIAPVTIESINALSPAPFLLAVAGAASWLQQKMNREPGNYGAWFFAQLVCCAAAVSLHPAGLAYPVMLWFGWWFAPADRAHRRELLIAIPLAVLVTLAMRLGFAGASWWQNPLHSAAAVFGGIHTAIPLTLVSALEALALIALAGAVAWHEGRRLLTDLTGGTLLLEVLIGMVAADRTWAVLMLALVLYGGLGWLLRACAPLAGRSLMLQRGWLWLLLFALCTAFMSVDRADYEAQRRGLLSAQDEVISDFAAGLNNLQAGSPGTSGAPVLVASSWPARTSIACRCGGLPLPPVAKDPQTQLAIMKGVSYLVLSDAAVNSALAENLARLGPQIEILSRRPGGAVLRVHPQGPAP